MQYNFDKYFTKVWLLYIHICICTYILTIYNNRLSFKKYIKNLNYIANIRKISILFSTQSIIYQSYHKI